MTEIDTIPAWPMQRRSMLFGAMAALAGTAANAQTGSYPSGPVRLITPSPAGSLLDVMARLYGQEMGNMLRQPFVVDGKPGAGGIIAAETVAKSAADGQMLLVAPDSMFSINPFIYSRLPYDPRKAFEPVALLAVSPNFILVNPKLNIQSFADLKEYGKTQKTIPFGTAGTGGAPHIVGELLRQQSGLPLVHVAYKGAGPAMADLVSGQVPFGISESVTADAYLKDKRIVPLAIGSAKRSPRYPDVPTLNELGYKDFDLSTWVGVYAPAGTPAPIMEKLNTEIRKAIAAPDTLEYIRSTGSEPGAMDVKEYQKYVGNDFDKWARVIQEAGVKDE